MARIACLENGMIAYLAHKDEVVDKVGTEVARFTTTDSISFSNITTALDARKSATSCYAAFGHYNVQQSIIGPIASTDADCCLLTETDYDDNKTCGNFSIAPGMVDVTFLGTGGAIVAYRDRVSTGMYGGFLQKVDDPSYVRFCSSNLSHFAIRKIDGSNALLIYDMSVYGYLYAVHVTSDPALGAPVSVDSSAVIDASSLAVLSTSKAIACYSTGGSLYARVINISGSTLTVGANRYMIDGSGTVSSCVMLTSTTALVFFKGSYAVEAVVMTISGDTISFGTPVLVETTSSTEAKATACSATSVVVAYAKSSKGYYRPLTISGTSISIGDAVCFDVDDPTAISLSAISATQAMVLYVKNGNSLWRRLVTA